MFNDSLERGSLPPSVTQASISLIPKKNKDPAECSSWKPIRLLNSDIKLLAKTLASRLDACLPNIISGDQTGFIRGRQLSSNIRRLLNIIMSKSSTQEAEMVISMDAEKAFDRVEWGYLFSALDKFGFGQRYISWIQLLYRAPTASVTTNSTHSHSLSVQEQRLVRVPWRPVVTRRGSFSFINGRKELSTDCNVFPSASVFDA